MEVVSGLRRFLLNDTTVAGYVQHRVWKDKLFEQIDGTGSRAVVVRTFNQHRLKDLTKTAEYPIVQTLCFADHSRDVDGLVVSHDAEDSARALWRAVDNALHGVRGVWMGDVLAVWATLHQYPTVGDPHKPWGEAQEAAHIVAAYAFEAVT